MTELLIKHIEFAAAHAQVWGFAIIFVLMAIESSFIPLPSEVIMIPAGFLAYRCSLTIGQPLADALSALIIGTLGSVAGAVFCYYFALWLGRPILYKYGKYFFIKARTLRRSEKVFVKHGDISVFVSRLIPGLRHLISIPAGLARMNLFRFSVFTLIGAGIWNFILTAVGYYLGHISHDMSYADLVYKGEKIVSGNFIYIFIVLIFIIAAYILVQYKVSSSSRDKR